MNCTNLLENLGFTCAPRNNGALRLWSPFTFDDGEHLGLFLEPLEERFIQLVGRELQAVAGERLQCGVSVQPGVGWSHRTDVQRKLTLF